MTREISFRCNLCGNHVREKEVHGLYFNVGDIIKESVNDPYSVDIHLCNSCYNKLKWFYYIKQE